MRDSKRDIDIKNRLLDSVGESKSGMIWENSTETCIAICEIDHQSRFKAWHRVLRAGHLDNPEGWDGEGGGRGIQDGGHMYTHDWFMWMYVKNHYNTVK